MNGLLVPPGSTSAQLSSALDVCERIAARDRSNLYLASRFFEDPARYSAFIAMYAVMRIVDDFVDDEEDKPHLPEPRREVLLRRLDDWERRIRAAYRGDPDANPIDLALCAAASTFPVPIEHWLAFIEAMRFDVRKPRFDDFDEFLRYGEGATVAPTSIYVYLLTSAPQPDGRYLVEHFDVAACGRDLGLFAYIAHVLRDVRRDLQVGESGLVYLSRDDLRRHGLSEQDLRRLVAGTVEAPVRERWGTLVSDLCGRAQAMRVRGTTLAQQIWREIPPDCAFIFRLIVGMYGALLDRIAADPARVLGPEPMFDDEEKLRMMRLTAAETGFPLRGVEG